MAVPKTDLEIVQGASFKYPVYVFSTPDVNVSAVATPLALAGCDAHMQIRTAPGATILVDAKSGAGIDIDIVNSLITIDLTGDMTSALTSPTAEYDLWLLKPDGERIPILMGSVTVDMTVTSPVVN